MRSLSLKWENKDEEFIYESYKIMLDDFKEKFDYFTIRSFIPGFAASFHGVNYSHWTSEGDKFKFDSYAGSFEMPLHLGYTMLKLAGCDVSRYGLIETWESVDENGNLIIETEKR